MSDTNLKDGDAYSDVETAARAEATLKRMLATPHRPHKNKIALATADGQKRGEGDSK